MISVNNTYRKLGTDEKISTDEEIHTIRTFLNSSRITNEEKAKELRRYYQDSGTLHPMINRIISVRR